MLLKVTPGRYFAVHSAFSHLLSGSGEQTALIFMPGLLPLCDSNSSSNSSWTCPKYKSFLAPVFTSLQVICMLQSPRFPCPAELSHPALVGWMGARLWLWVIILGLSEKRLTFYPITRINLPCLEEETGKSLSLSLSFSFPLGSSSF